MLQSSSTRRDGDRRTLTHDDAQSGAATFDRADIDGTSDQPLAAVEVDCGLMPFERRAAIDQRTLCRQLELPPVVKILRRIRRDIALAGERIHRQSGAIAHRRGGVAVIDDFAVFLRTDIVGD